MNPRILILDTYYPEVIRAMPVNPAGTYESELQAILNQSFGTFDAYSRNLKALGWDAEDVIVNHFELNSLRKEQYPTADVLFLQDLSVEFVGLLAAMNPPGLIAAQLSCPWPGDDAVRKCDCIFTSFPHYVARIEALGVRAVYNPLAFDPIVLERATGGHLCACCKSVGHGMIVEDGTVYCGLHQPRIHDVVFIGGVGNPGHWKRGMEMLNAVAEAIPTFKWWGYGDMNGCGAALSRAYQGEAWGLDMYRILLQSKIVLNRHGEVAEGFTNNMRCFEATGCGAVVLTEASSNLDSLFEPNEVLDYHSTQEAIEFIQFALSNDNFREIFARYGRQRTVRDHTYAQRMKTVSETLKEMLNASS